MRKGVRWRSGSEDTVISRMERRALLVLALMLPAARLRAASDKPGAKAVPNGPIFVQLPIFQVPVIQGNQVRLQVSLTVALELVQGLSADSIEPKKPLLIDAFLRDLYAIFAQRANQSRVADDQLIRVRLQQIADRVLGPGIVRRVLIQQLFEQKLEG